nr:HlyD family secretion protein [Methyloceanibacter methanicus]
MVEVGQWVTPGTAVFELVAMKNFRVDAPVPQDYYAQLRDGADVAIAIDTLPGEEIPAKIGALIPVSDPDARTFTLRVLPTRKNIPYARHVGARPRRPRHGPAGRGGQPGRADPLSGWAHHRLDPEERW